MTTTPKNRNLTVRIVTALALIPPILFLLYRGGGWTAGLLAAAAAVCTSEYYLIVFKRLPVVAWVTIGASFAMPLLPVLSPRTAWERAFFLVAAVFLFSWTWHLLRGPLGEAPTHAAHALTALVFGAMGMTSLSALRVLPEANLGIPVGDPETDWMRLAWVIATLVITWGNDTCAYFAGRLFGRHKLYPEVSPNKTWEGFFGGMAGSVLGMVILDVLFFPFLTPLDDLVVGIAGGLFGPVGDLAESMLKRAHGVKDSGKILPGHGGVLDRIDALLFNAPMVFAWVAFVRPLVLR